MKKKISLLAIAILSLICVFALAACDTGGTTEAATYTVTYNSNGGSTINSVTQDKGTQISKPSPNPTNGDKEFGGWFYDTGLSRSAIFPFTLDKNYTLYAKWNELVDRPEILVYTLINVAGYEVSKGDLTNVTEIEIPAVYNEKPVIKIADNAFANCIYLTKVTIANGIMSIGAGAFNGCASLTNLIIPETVVAIGEYAFNNISFNTPWYGAKPDGAVYINKVFYDYKGTMPKNTSIEILDGTVSITDGALYGYNEGLISLSIPGSVLSIGEKAFSGCINLASLTILEGVKNIGKGAFNVSALTSVTIPDTIITIGAGAFVNSAWFSNKADGVVYIGEVLYTYKGDTMPSDTSIVILDGTISITEGAFQNCRGLTSVTIPDSVTSIGDAAFSSRNPSMSITLSGGNCYFKIENSCLIEIGSGRLINGWKSGELTIPSGVNSIGTYAFCEMTELISVKISDSVTTIGASAFYGCTNLINATIPNGITTIGASAFYGCTNLTNATIPNGITAIGDAMFYNCTNLETVQIPSSVTSIGYQAFGGCTNLVNITIPSGVTRIGVNAFTNCTNIPSLTIPASVKYLEMAFMNWTNSQRIYVEGFANQSDADAAWGVSYGTMRWRSNCFANIIYLG